MSKPSLRDQILEISQDYLGPAAERFVDRQISTHLAKAPDKITPGDLANLIDWIRLSFALLTKDAELIDEYAGRLMLVAQGKSQQAMGEKWNQD